MLDQPAGLIRKMNAAKYTYNTFKSRITTNDVISWIDADPDRHDYYTEVREMLKNGD